jgi:hypothetical protein
MWMLRALLVVVGWLRSAWLVELAGAGLIVAGVHQAWGVAAALCAAGVFLLLKAYEIEAGS